MDGYDLKVSGIIELLQGYQQPTTQLSKLETVSGDIKSQIYGYDDIRIVSPPIISKNVSAIHLNVHAAVVPIPSIAIQHIII